MARVSDPRLFSAAPRPPIHPFRSCAPRFGIGVLASATPRSPYRRRPLPRTAAAVLRARGYSFAGSRAAFL